MKEFSLEEYLKNPNREVVTRDGRKVTRILCTDAKTYFPIVALVEVSPGSTDECLRTFTKDGRYFTEENSPCDLFFAPKKHEGWVNVYYRGSYQLGSNVIYRTEDEAIAASEDVRNYIKTIKIEWEK